MKNRIHKGMVLLAVLMLVVVTGCSSNLSDKKAIRTDHSLQNVMEAKQLIVGSDTGFPPMGYENENGEIVGFDIDVAEAVCNRLGVKLVVKGIDWGKKEEELDSGNIDCVWSGMSVTPDRAEAMNLSEPYMKNELIFLIPGNSEARGTQDLQGKRVGVSTNSTALDALKSMATKVEIVECEDEVDMFQKLEEGNLDAMLVDSVAAYYFLSQTGKTYYVLPESLQEEDYAIGFRKEDQSLRDKIQEILGMLKEDGTLGRISKQWFGSDITIVR